AGPLQRVAAQALQPLAELRRGQGLQQAADRSAVPGGIGYEQVVLLRADGQEVQPVEPRRRVYAHARVRRARGYLRRHGRVRRLLAAVAVDGGALHALAAAEVVRQDARAGALLPAYVAQAGTGDVGKAAQAEGVARGEHEALRPAHALDEAHSARGEEALDIALVIAAGGLVEQVCARGVALAPAHGHEPAHGADVA